MITQTQIDQYNRDGAICIRQAVLTYSDRYQYKK